MELLVFIANTTEYWKNIVNAFILLLILISAAKEGNSFHFLNIFNLRKYLQTSEKIRLLILTKQTYKTLIHTVVKRVNSARKCVVGKAFNQRLS